MRYFLLFPVVLFSFFQLSAQDAIDYQVPDKAIYDLAMADPSPTVSMNEKGSKMLLLQRSAMPGVEELAQPELRIAGLRINPNNFGPSRSTYITGIRLKDISTGKEQAIAGLPVNLKAGGFIWSPKDTRIAFTNTTGEGIHLYVINLAENRARRVNKQPLNTTLGNNIEWLDDQTVLYLTTTKDASHAPQKGLAPKGPVVQQNLGKVGASATYQDLIKSPYDEQLFEFYATSQLVKNVNGIETKIGQPAMFNSFDISPDKKYLLVEKIDKPFSYLVTAGGFNSTIAVMDLSGKTVSTIDKLPSQEGRPSGFDNVLNAPRGHQWVNSLPSTISFIMPLDSGMIRKTATHRDALYYLPAPFDRNKAVEIYKSTQRMGGMIPLNENELLVSENSRIKHQAKLTRVNIAGKKAEILFDRSTDDAYNDPGMPVYANNQYGKPVPKVLNGNTILMRGTGSTPQGDMPFLRSFNMDNKETKEIWRSKAPYYETVIDVTDFDKMHFITSRQSQSEPPNYYLYAGGNANKITAFPDPQPQLRGVTKEKISYKRKDSIDLAFDLYLPPGYNKEKDGRLPVIVWAYPREFKSSADAAQVRGSQYTFVRAGYGSMLFWATQGYAVLDNAEFPIVGEGDKQPNDTYVDQLVWNAEAALKKIYDMGIGDTSRAAVGGHSYGAFMTANLLGHSNMFKAGIARSGAYNRTLTPFGFQNEERTYWQAPDLYFAMSPFSVANQIKTPLLLIHGEADNNPGTFPIQSERLYNAIKGHGGIVRLVFLPYESHGYAAKENILHMLWEQQQWLDKYVKNAGK